MRLHHTLNVLFCSFFFSFLGAQCPELTSENSTPDCAFNCDLCLGDDITFELTGTGMNDGDCIDWYIDLNGAVSTGSQFIGCSPITTDCAGGPQAMYVLVDPPPGPDRCDEYIVLHTGDTGFIASDVDVENMFMNTLSPYVMGNTSVFTPDCGLIAADASTFIPSDAILIIQSSAIGTEMYDINELCVLGLPIYVLASNNTSCDGGFFINAGNSLYTVSLAGCDSYEISFGNDPNAWSFLDGEGDWITAVPPMQIPNFNPGLVTIGDFNFQIDQTILDNFCTAPSTLLDVQGFLNPQAGGGCADVETGIFNLTISCPEANPAGPLEECEVNGSAVFDLTSLQNTISGGSGAVTWFEDAGLNTQIFNTLSYSGGSPVYAIVNINGCSSEAVQVDLITLAEPNADAGIFGAIECLGADIDLEETGGDAVSWEWDGPNFTSMDQNPTVTAAEAGTYTVVVTDANGCMSTDQVDYFPPSGPSIVWDLGSATVCQNDCVELPFTITGGTAPYIIDVFGSAGIPFLDETCQYDIAAGVNSISLCLTATTFGVDCDNAGGIFGVPPIVTTLVTTGFFEITYIEDANGCIGTPNPGNMTVTLAAPETPVDPGPLEVCGTAGTNVDFDIASLEGTIGGGEQVLWFEDAALTTAITSSPYTTNMSTTIYAVVDNGSCPSDAIAIQLNIVDAPNAGMNGLIDVCTLESDAVNLFAALGAGAASNGSWTDEDGAGVSFANDMAINFVGVAAGTYDFTYTITGTAGCPDASAVVTVNVNQSPSFSFFDDACINSNMEYMFTLNTGVPTDVLIDVTGATISGGGAEYVFTIPAVMGPVTITATDPLTMCSNEFMFTFMGCDCGAVADPTNQDIEYCSDEAIPAIDAMIEAGLTANWYDDMGMLVFTGNPFQPTAPGTYFIEAVDSDGCTSSQVEFELIEETTFLVGQSNEVFVCAGGTFNLLDALSGNTFVGEFTDTTAVGALTGTFLNTDVLVEGNAYLFSHFGSGIFPCEEDAVADIVVNIVSMVSAGPNVLDTLCAMDAYDLINSLPPDADLGGVFSDPNNTGTLSGSIFTPSTGGPFGFLYTVGGGACPEDVSEIVIDVRMETTVSFTSQITDLCEGACGEFLLEYSSDSAQAFFEIVDEDGNVDIDTLVLGPSPSASFPLIVCNNFNPAVLEFLILEPSHEYTITLFGVETFGGCAFEFDEIIELTTYGNDTLFIDQTLCTGGSLNVGGQVFDESNPSDTLVLNTIFNCDSIIAVNLEFTSFSELVVDGEVCNEFEVELNGTTYDINNQSGSDMIPGGSVFGCDSVITVDLEFLDAAVGNFTGPICENETVTIGGIDFNMGNPIGSAVIDDGSAQGCDTTVMVNLQFHPPAEFLMDDELCTGESIIILGEVFDENNPTGSVLIPSASVNGCDSIVNVSLTFSTQLAGEINGMFCPDFSVTVNNEVYDINNQTGSELLLGGSAEGCDSLVNIDLEFFPVSEDFLNLSLCPGSVEIINGTEYSETNLSGTEIFPNASVNGCDSTLFVTVSIDQEVMASLTDTLCAGESITLGGMTFDENTPSGSAVVNASSAQECDTMFMVNLVFDRNYQFSVAEGCEGDDFVEVTLVSADILNFPISIMNTGDGQTYQTNSLPFSFFVSTAGASAEIIDANACSEVQIFQINVNNNPQLDAILGSIVGDGFNVSFTSNVSIDSVVWSPSSLVECVNCVSTIASAQDSSMLFLEAYYGNGCVLFDTLIIAPVASTDIYIPSIFSANNDGSNDVFFVQSESEYELRDFTIYDRWGNRVYYVSSAFTNDPAIGWEGDWNGVDLNPGVYVYYFDVEIPGRGVLRFAGNVTLLR